MVTKTNHVVSSIPLDQAHEQQNKLLKQQGGIIGLTSDNESLQKWCLYSSKLLRLCKDFQSQLNLNILCDDDISILLHYEESQAAVLNPSLL